MELVVATNNRGKLAEIRSLLPGFDLLTLADIGFTAEIPEPYDTFQENALEKAATVYRFCGKPVMADDSGICIAALNGAPGVHSARFAGQPTDDHRNTAKVLELLEGAADRSASYRAVICLIDDSGRAHYFEGVCNGQITTAPSGTGGFGYDPVFQPDGYRETFGQLPQEVKNNLSHRSQAVKKMAAFLLQQPGERQD